MKTLKKDIINLTPLKFKTSINKAKKIKERLPGKLFATHISNKGLIIKTCKELSQIKMKNQQPNGNFYNIYDSTGTEEEI